MHQVCARGGSVNEARGRAGASGRICGCARRAFRLHGALTMDSTRIGVTLAGPSGDVEKGRRLVKAQELRDKTPDQLRDQLASLKKEAFNLRFQKATGQLENTSRMQVVRRDAARVKTILNQKATAAASADQKAEA